MLAVLSTAPFGGADIAEADRCVRQLRAHVGDDEKWFEVWREGGDRLYKRARADEEQGHRLTAAGTYLRACAHYQHAEHFRHPKDEAALTVYRLAWGAIWDYYATWERRIKALREASLPVPADHLLWVTGTPTYEEALAKLEGFRLEGIAQKVECPFLLTHGTEDAQVPMADAQKLFDAIGSKDKTFRIFDAEEGGAQHCQRDYLTLVSTTIADWLAGRLRERG
jgi:pimeloyl-ACP methyl ester carboxylesterase